MTISANLYELAALIVALAFLIFVIALIPTLVQLKKTVKAVEDLTNESKKTVETLNIIMQKAGEQAGNIEELVKKLTEVGMNVAGLLNLLVDNIKSPLIGIISLIFGVESGFKRFLRRHKKGGGQDDT